MISICSFLFTGIISLLFELFPPLFSLPFPPPEFESDPLPELPPEFESDEFDEPPPDDELPFSLVGAMISPFTMPGFAESLCESPAVVETGFSVE